ncbi:hypothetical protein BT96DRAFT_978941 [Gymnopus androsaceus JB14]|uniref:Uncharacterized protein n=1 Tax=Gymnopus androsaceus JB14 TaxID=1447944 RepID=A0A6A4H897_9AGAR|nr:hypothetical protein BT96DRAFT_978941 [Gymnopus androsaceus JB14]
MALCLDISIREHSSHVTVWNNEMNQAFKDLHRPVLVVSLAPQDMESGCSPLYPAQKAGAVHPFICLQPSPKSTAVNCSPFNIEGGSDAVFSVSKTVPFPIISDLRHFYSVFTPEPRSVNLVGVYGLTVYIRPRRISSQPTQMWRRTTLMVVPDMKDATSVKEATPHGPLKNLIFLVIFQDWPVQDMYTNTKIRTMSTKCPLATRDSSDAENKEDAKSGASP